ncbi:MULTISPECIES: hypothetical protein [Bacillus cereus group]|nr:MULTISPECIES: hypothetical protein [Bacillus cereus group]EEL49929.1 hypothetical protein bcere0022_27040 [Bacillus cereus Rock3-44]
MESLFYMRIVTNVTSNVQNGMNDAFNQEFRKMVTDLLEEK